MTITMTFTLTRWTASRSACVTCPHPHPHPNQVDGLSLGPRYMCFHQGRHVCYVVNELSSQVALLQYHPNPNP